MSTKQQQTLRYITQTQFTNQNSQNINPVPFYKLFRFAKKIDIIMIIIGTFAGIANGALVPVFTFIGGDLTDQFDDQSPFDNVMSNVLKFVYVGLGSIFASSLMFTCFVISGERQSIQYRVKYLQSIIKQQNGWFDKINSNQLASRVQIQCNYVHKALGQKISTFIMSISSGIGGIIIAFYKGPQLAAVISATLPLMILITYLLIYMFHKINQLNSEAYAKAGGLAQESITNIKTVKSLNGEQFVSKRYSQHVRQAAKKTSKYGLLNGIAFGCFYFILFASYSLGFWYGAKIVTQQPQRGNPSIRQYTGGTVLIIFFSIITGGMSLGQAAPCFKVFAQGKQAASKIFNIIDRNPLIKNAINPIFNNKYNGFYQFINVNFAYSTRPQIQILKNINLNIKPNVKNAIVGESGCGKSTIMQMMLRFYDPNSGQIILDNNNIKNYQLTNLRSSFGYVCQQPVLFATSIKQNIQYGKPKATDQQIWQALKQAQAYDFVKQMENQLETYVGIGGGQLSGGQKQRIAIARALINNPNILFLDEATSALDRKNEKLIQKTLDMISKNRTSIVIAHKLQTIMDAENIIVIDKGKVVEQGTYLNLINKKGKFAVLALNQQNDKQLSHIEIKKENKRKTQFERKKSFLQIEQQKMQQKIQLIKKYQGNIFSRLFYYIKGKYPFLFLAIICSIANGILFPLFSLFLSQMIVQLTLLQSVNLIKPNIQKINRISLNFLIISIASFFINFGQISFFIYISQNMTMKIRQQILNKLIKMKTQFFDNPINTTGSLTSVLSTDAIEVNGLASYYIGMNIQNLSSLVTGLVIAFVYSWKLTLITLSLIPLMILSNIVEIKFLTKFSDQVAQSYKESSILVIQVINGIRTLKSFAQQKQVIQLYKKKMQKPLNIAFKKGIIIGILFGLSQFIMYVIFGVVFLIGAKFIQSGDIPGNNRKDQTLNMFIAIFSIIFAAMGISNNSQFMTDITAGILAASKLFLILDEEDQNQYQEKNNKDKLNTKISGKIQFVNVSFKYPNRENQLFQKLNFKIQCGQKVAFVGLSGCGKSTVLQLIQRFYIPNQGQILFDDNPIQKYDLHYLRSHLGVVSQQPVLFNGTIKQNIVYNLINIPEKAIQQATKKALIYKFIVQNYNQAGKLDGFNCMVGNKGTRLSVGQKQRIAISRAILRNSTILILDQATSALDYQSQRLVQSSLNRLMVDKTTIIIAHRIQTIKKCDIIFVFENGRIIQKGNYKELINKKGYFYRLQRGQIQ